jgi:hypothetical protein
MAQPVPSDATGHAAPSLRSSRRTTWRSPWYSTMSPKRSSSAWISVMTGCPPFLVTSSSGAGRSASSLLTNSNDDRTARRPRPWSQRGHSARTGAWSDGPQGSDQRQKNGRLLCLPLCPTKELRLQNATGCQRSPGCPRVWPCSIAGPDFGAPSGLLDDRPPPRSEVVPTIVEWVVRHVRRHWSPARTRPASVSAPKASTVTSRVRVTRTTSSQCPRLRCLEGSLGEADGVGVALGRTGLKSRVCRVRESARGG